MKTTYNERNVEMKIPEDDNKTLTLSSSDNPKLKTIFNGPILRTHIV
jgi:uncharacterized protein YajQ (UPF0234 family)